MPPDNEAADIDAIMAGAAPPKPRPRVRPAGTLAAPASDELDDEDIAQVRELAKATEAQHRQQSFKEQAVGDEPAWPHIWADVKETAKPGSAALEGFGNFLSSDFADEANANSLEGAVQRPPGEPPREYKAGSQFDDNLATLEAERLKRAEDNPLSSLGGEVGAGVLQGATRLGAAPLAPALVAADYMGQGHGNLSERAAQALEMAQEHPILTGLAAGGPLALHGIGQAKAGTAAELRGLQNERTVEAFTNQRARDVLRAQRGLQGLRQLGQDVRDRGLEKGSFVDRIFGAKPKVYHANAQKLIEEAAPGMATAEDAITELGDPSINTGATVEQLRDRAKVIGGRGDTAREAHKNFIEGQADVLEQNQLKNPGIPGPKPIAPWELPPAEGPWTAGLEPAYAPADPKDLKAFESLLEPTAPTAPVAPSPIAPPAEPLSPWFEGPWTAEQPGVHPTASQKGAQTKLINKAKKAGEPPPAPLEERATVPPQGPGPEPPEGHVLQHKQAIKEQQGQYKKETAAQDRQYKQDVKEYKTGQKEYEALKKKFDAAQAKGPPKGKMIDKGEAPKGPDSPPSQEELDAFYAAQKAHLTPEPVPSGKTKFSTALPDLRYTRDQINFDTKNPGAGMQEHERRLQVASQQNEIEKGLEQAAAEDKALAPPIADWMKHKKDYHVAASVRDPALAVIERGEGAAQPTLKDLALLGFGGSPATGMVAANKAMEGRWPSFAANVHGARAGALEAAATGIPKTSGALRAGTSPKPSSEEQKAKNQSLTEKLAELSHGSWNWLEEHLPGG